MTKLTIGEWAVCLKPDTPDPLVIDHDGRPVATVHGDAETAWERACLLAATPTMRDTLAATAFVLTLIAKRGVGWSAESAADMLPAARSALAGAGVDVEQAMPPDLREPYRWLLAGGSGEPPQ